MLLIALAVLMLIVVAQAAPIIPKEYQGSWCRVDEESGDQNAKLNRGNCEKPEDIPPRVTPSGYSSQNEECAVIKVTKYRRYHYMELRCRVRGGPAYIDKGAYQLRDGGKSLVTWECRNPKTCLEGER
jgi:hypothetical protein